MRDIIKRIIRQYGMRRIHYSVVTYGDPPQTKLRFINNIRNDETLERFIDTISVNNRGADLAGALRSVQRLFDEAETIRSGSKKVLVLITDKRSGMGWWSYYIDMSDLLGNMLLVKFLYKTTSGIRVTDFYIFTSEYIDWFMSLFFVIFCYLFFFSRS